MKRIKKLKAAGVIVGSHLELMRGTLGYHEEASIGIAAENSKIDEIAQKVREIPNVVVCAKSIGRYNLFAHVFAKDLVELDNVTHLIKSIKGIRSISINIHVEEFLKYSGLPLKKSGDSKDKLNDLDKTDLKIINELLEDAQTPFLRIARKLGISHETVRQRYEKLRKNEIIQECSIIIDRSKLGFQGTAFFLISCAQNQSKESTISELINIQAFHDIAKVIGSAFDIFASVPIKDLKDLGKLTDKIEKMPSIESVEVATLIFTYYSFAPKPRGTYKCDNIGLS